MGIPERETVASVNQANMLTMLTLRVKHGTRIDSHFVGRTLSLSCRWQSQFLPNLFGFRGVIFCVGWIPESR